MKHSTWCSGITPPEAVERLSLSYGPYTFYDLFFWSQHELSERDKNFQRLREALKK